MPALAAVASPNANALLKISDRTISFSFLLLPIMFSRADILPTAYAAPYCGGGNSGRIKQSEQ